MPTSYLIKVYYRFKQGNFLIKRKEREEIILKRFLVFISMVGVALLFVGKLFNKETNFPIEKLGQPDDLDDADMVSEGSQFGVQYYNKHVQHNDAQVEH